MTEKSPGERLAYLEGRVDYISDYLKEAQMWSGRPDMWQSQSNPWIRTVDDQYIQMSQVTMLWAEENEEVAEESWVLLARVSGVERPVVVSVGSKEKMKAELGKILR